LAGFGPATGDSIDAGFDDLDECDYHSRLPTLQLVAEVRRLLATERRAERLVCRYLADLADRVQARQDAELGAYADEFHAARSFFGLGTRETRERVRVGRALRRLPQIERAFTDGDLSYSRVREVTRVATVHTERGWLELAQRLDMRSLERRVATEREATDARSDGRGERRVDKPARTEWTGPETVRVTFELSSQAWALLERAMREARRAGAAGFSDGEALEAVARAALSVQTQRADAGDAGCRVVAYERPTSGDSAPEAGAGVAELGPSTAAGRGCGVAARGATAFELGTQATQLGSAAALPTRATQRGSADALQTRATQLGSAAARGQGQTPGATTLEVSPDRTRGASSGDPTDQRIDGERVGVDERVGVGSGEQALACEPAVHLIHVMGDCRGWTLDALTEASGLSAQEVCVALTLLELGGRVRRRAFAFDPV
jgi:hypothetical protein